jgi:oxygen-independent coproporphyrinogen-3 oxidase
MKIDKKILDKYNIPVPRYTSYPPANHFKEGFAESEYLQFIEQSNDQKPNHIALYIHIPFCKKICFYCGCNACTIKDEQLIEEYIEALKKEISKVFGSLDKNRKVSQIHYGGGTPNAIDVKYIEEINNLIFNEFSLIDNPEIAIECNPAQLDYDYIDRLLGAKFNRFSLGIQDFNTEVLKSVNRSPSALPVNEIVSYLKNKNPLVAVNLDFIYGLPGQNTDGFLRTIEQAVKIKPDRLVTFSYAHVPWLKKHQIALEKKGLPSSELKMEMFLSARELLIESGYTPVGLDHYVLPKDELSQALNQNSLHRNFQGYCTKRTTGQVYAFGVSSISQLEKGYAQNVKELDVYIETINQGRFPVEKRMLLTEDQIIVREIINELMCNNQLDLLKLAEKYQITIDAIKKITGFNKNKLENFISDDLMTFIDNKIKVSEKGSLFIRNIAATFDPEYIEQENKYSKTV